MARPGSADSSLNPNWRAVLLKRKVRPRARSVSGLPILRARGMGDCRERVKHTSGWEKRSEDKRHCSSCDGRGNCAKDVATRQSGIEFRLRRTQPESVRRTAALRSEERRVGNECKRRWLAGQGE